MRIILLLTYILSIFFFSCEDAPIINCNDCLSEEPTNATIIIKVDQVRRSQTHVEVYSGNFEDRILYDTFEATSSELTLTLPVNNKYTMTATYQIDGKTYVAVDTAFPRVKFSEDQCDEPCYYIYDKSVNLMLKYKD